MAHVDFHLRSALAILFLCCCLSSHAEPLPVEEPTCPPGQILFSPPPGFYQTAQAVTVTTDPPGGILHYTVSGQTPQFSGPIPSGPISVPLGSSLTVRFWSPDDPFGGSCVVTAHYSLGTAPATFSPPSGPAFDGMEVAIHPGSEGSAIWYHISYPDTSSVTQEHEYTGPITIHPPPISHRHPAQVYVHARTVKEGLPDGDSTAV